MKRWVILLSMAAIAVVALGLFRPGTADAAPTTARLNSLNAILSDTYDAWVQNYPTHMARASNSWMDWSEDGCSVPDFAANFSISVSNATKFIHACERHDFMWRTLAVLDAGTGRVWHERNRFVADNRLNTDLWGACLQHHYWGDNYNLPAYRACRTVGNGFHAIIRNWSGYRTTLLPDELNSVTYGNSAYRTGYTMLASDADCIVNTNRCLPITYMEFNGKPFAPKRLASMPVGIPMKMTLVRANHASVTGLPIDVVVHPAFDNPWQNTGELKFSAKQPFVVSQSPTVTCAERQTIRDLYADSGEYPIPASAVSTERLKRTDVYVLACSPTTDAQELVPQLEAHLVQAFKHRSGSMITRIGKRIRHFQNINAEWPPATLTPDPATLTVTQASTWYGPVRVSLTSPLTSVTIVANPTGADRVLEYSTTGTAYTPCTDGANQNETSTLTSGLTLHIQMCEAGTGVIEFRHPTKGHLLNRYTVTLADATPTPDPVVPPPAPTGCTEIELTHDTQNIGPATWSTSDCTSDYYTGRRIDYYTITPIVSGRVIIRLESTEDTFLALYRGVVSSNNRPYLYNDNYGSGTNSRIAVTMNAEAKYIIGATTRSPNVTGTYYLYITMPTVPRPDAPVVQGSAGNATATLRWALVDGATGYDIQHYANGAWTIMPETDYTLHSSKSRATITGLTNGVDYYYRVRAKNARYTSGWSNPFTTVTPTVTLRTPRNLRGTGGDTVSTLSWTAVTHALEYQVAQWNGRATPPQWMILPFREVGHAADFTVRFNGTTATVSNLLNGVRYSQRVRAKNGLVYSPWTNWVNVSVQSSTDDGTRDSGPQPPPTPPPAAGTPSEPATTPEAPPPDETNDNE